MVKIAVLGFGVVGSGTVELFYKNKCAIEKRAGVELDIKYILDIRNFPDSPYKDKLVSSIDVILNDNEISVVAEMMGGLVPSFKFVKSCLERGKSVVSSNKELIAEKGAELLAIARENNCNLFFEASVGGAIPIIRPLHICLAGNEITEITGILNGTTNFILTKMFDENMSFDEALCIARERGYAESDPSSDIEGDDACRKICILSSLVFGNHIYPSSVYTRGITQISKADVAAAGKAGYEIKLIASVKKTEDGKILPFVSPMLVPRDNMLSNVEGVFNAVMVTGDGIDKVMMYGRGAGRLPTASAVVGDIIEAAKSSGTVVSQHWTDSGDTSLISDFSELVCPVFLRADDVELKAVFPDAADIDSGAVILPPVSIRTVLDKKAELLKDGKKISMIPVLV